MSNSFSDSSMGVSQEALLDSAYLYKGWLGEIEFTFKWELVLKHAGDTHWVRQDLTISREQADSLHKVLGHMLSNNDVTEDTMRWFVSGGKVKAESEPVG